MMICRFVGRMQLMHVIHTWFKRENMTRKQFFNFFARGAREIVCTARFPTNNDPKYLEA
jgi:hypothetical protein